MFVGEEPERGVSDHEWLARVSSRLLLQCHTYRYDIEKKLRYPILEYWSAKIHVYVIVI